MSKKEKLLNIYGLLFVAGSFIGAVGFSERLPWEFNTILIIIGPLICAIAAFFFLRVLLNGD
jgi:hypothetical protein